MKNSMYTIFFIALAFASTTVLTMWYLGRGLSLWVSILAAFGTAIGAWIALVLAIISVMTVIVLVMSKYNDYYFGVGFKRWLAKHDNR